MTDSGAEAAGIRETRITLYDGKKYPIGRTTVGDMLALEKHLSENADDGHEVDQAETLAYAFTLPGIAFLLRRNLERHGHNMTFEQVAELVGPFDDTGDKVMAAFGITLKDREEMDADPPKKAFRSPGDGDSPS